MRYVSATLAIRFLLMLLLAFFASCPIQARDIKIGLFFNRKITTVVFTPVGGEYIIYGDYRQVGVARKGFIYHIDNSGGVLTIQDTLNVIGSFSRIEFKGISRSNIFSIRPVIPSLPPRESDDNLLLQGEADFMRIINILDLEKYIAGTIETEGGSNAHPEYYKAQAILARTFAVKNFYRHGSEGFNLCDTEHCQAYKGKSRMNPEIHAAVMATKELVMCDMNGHLVNTPYHSNCGGMTSDAFQAWKQPLPHLQPVIDQFCRNSKNAKWESMLSRDEWIAYLTGKGFKKDRLMQADLSFSPASREKYYRIGEHQVELTEVRRDLKLKSAWFSIVTGADKIRFQGKGYGHGVGMCQEGAMEMARKGYVYVDILHFYFRNIKIESIPERR
ncbi:MAG: SpoIID/LytB domain-containing protein [Bacteroidales bacterium]|nr:SpoIID/LytB domain-containing protein [Bacteroidales bacterium]